MIIEYILYQNKPSDQLKVELKSIEEKLYSLNNRRDGIKAVLAERSWQEYRKAYELCEQCTKS